MRRAAEHQVRATAGGGVVDEAFQSCRTVGGKLAAPERNDFQTAPLHFHADRSGLLGRGGHRDDQFVFTLGSHQTHVFEARCGDAVEGHAVVMGSPRPSVAADLPAQRLVGERRGCHCGAHRCQHAGDKLPASLLGRAAWRVDGLLPCGPSDGTVMRDGISTEGRYGAIHEQILFFFRMGVQRLSRGDERLASWPHFDGIQESPVSSPVFAV